MAAVPSAETPAAATPTPAVNTFKPPDATFPRDEPKVFTPDVTPFVSSFVSNIKLASALSFYLFYLNMLLNSSIFACSSGEIYSIRHASFRSR